MKELERQQKEVRPRLWGGAWGCIQGGGCSEILEQGAYLYYVEIVCMELMLIMEKCGKNADRGKDFISVKPA